MTKSDKKSLHEAAGQRRPKKLAGPQPFYREFTKTWYLQLGKRQINLGRAPVAALQKYHELMASRHDVESTVDTTVCKLLDAFLDWVKDWREQGTYEWYAGHLSAFAKHVGTGLKLLDLREKHVTCWIDEQHKASSPNTIYGAIRCVQTALNWAVKRGLIPKSPVKNVEKPTQQPRDKVITQAQFDEMVSRASDEQERELFTILWETGCRVQEVRSVEACHFNEAERCWSFPRVKSKGKRAPRTVYLTDAAFEITKRRAELNPEGPIFRNRRGKPWTKNAIRLRFRKIVKPPRMKCSYCGKPAVAFIRGAFVPKAEKKGRQRRYVCDMCVKEKHLTDDMLGKIRLPIPGMEGACAMNFRHSFATRALKNRVAGLTVSVLLGHRDTRMISRVYGHLEKDPQFLHEELRRATESPKPRDDDET